MIDFIQVFEGDGKDHKFDHFLYGDDKLLQRTGSGYYYGEQNGNGLGQGDFLHF